MIETDYSGSIIWDTNAGGWIELNSTIDVKLSKALTIATNLFITNGDIDLEHVDKKLKLPIKNDATSPTLQFGDGDTGFYESADDVLDISIGGVAKWEINGDYFHGLATGAPALRNETTSATNPTILPRQTDLDTGIGKAAADALSLIAGGVEGHRITETGGTITHILTDDVGITGNLDVNGDLDVDGTVQGDLLNNYMVQKATFDILGLMDDPRLLTSLECTDPGAGTLLDVSGQGHTGTYQGSMTTTDRLKKNMGWGITFDGSNDYISFPDHNDFSFGDASNDEAVTWFGVFEAVNMNAQPIITKWDAISNIREWYVELPLDEKIQVNIYDESLNVSCFRQMDTGLSIGWHSYVITYPGTGGAAAADNIIIYVDGTLVASTASNNANYVAMENSAEPVMMGGKLDGMGNEYFHGDQAFNGIDGSVWTAFKAHRFHQLIKGIYGL